MSERAPELLRYLIENERDWEIWGAAAELLAVVEAAESLGYFAMEAADKEGWDLEQALASLVSKLSGEAG